MARGVLLSGILSGILRGQRQLRDPARMDVKCVSRYCVPCTRRGYRVEVQKTRWWSPRTFGQS
ncbi:hypothetical protein PF005_g8036 [Phytophthora fragariae]|uniref:Uncharacterized protein n=1 Tax=Phytophthora fragariae TaxID=53985 RepID=A0A6A3T042_9STRA|nr:hypothetical protein PF003_g6515 [Phytophthora fragariae]KAE8937637.1 hypothetical protein PF009_g12464 [Phytophthora fragariae]KAE9090820.1 hypothetical protein PF007_g19099 [Phytophthora fragariae]KAE9123949.1 hypothetical protein PF006_g17309 [Phytophthora fragariae]KAE9207754.1 hypothetical protein PF002_g19617 [Phytophthora fragariae]